MLKCFRSSTASAEDLTASVRQQLDFVQIEGGIPGVNITKDEILTLAISNVIGSQMDPMTDSQETTASRQTSSTVSPYSTPGNSDDNLLLMVNESSMVNQPYWWHFGYMGMNEPVIPRFGDGIMSAGETLTLPPTTASRLQDLVSTLR